GGADRPGGPAAGRGGHRAAGPAARLRRGAGHRTAGSVGPGGYDRSRDQAHGAGAPGSGAEHLPRRADRLRAEPGSGVVTTADPTQSLRTPLTTLVGAKSAKLLGKALGLHTAGELLRHYPRRYAQRGELTDIAGVEIGEHVTVVARVLAAHQPPMRHRRGTRVEVTITDGARLRRLAGVAAPAHR